MEQNYKILVADDSETYLRIIQQIFEIVGYQYEIIFARNGRSACQQALLHKPDLILLDVIMPEVNGIEAAKYLRENPKTSDIPIIMLSSTESLKAAYEVGANDFISKPFNQYELLIKVRSAIDLVSKIKKIEAYSKEVEKSKNQIQQKHDLIAEQQGEMVGDLTYSKRIQKSILPNQRAISRIIPDYFILNLPRNIVSGDFYWVGRHGAKDVISVADCTGHGISGALMTMAGMAFLNDIMARTDKVLQANEVLFELRKMVMNLLKQTGELGEASDGMDISLTMLNKERSKIWFAGANNPLYLIRKGELQVFKGDRMPIGIHLNFERPFTLHELDIEKGDIVYLFSDGFADQFGGPRDKKFRYKQFKDLLLDVHDKPFEEQKKIVLKVFDDWKGDNMQIDDVLVLGYRI